MTATFDGESVKAELNQYWYSPRTITALLSEATHHATRCAFLSTPSLYFALGASGTDGINDGTNDADAEAAHARAVTLRKNSKLFEYDRQWSSDPGFVFYDFTKPEQIPIQYMNYFDYVVVDPPFITEEVWARYMETIRLIIRRDPAATVEGGAPGPGAVRDCLGGGKVLFTTVLENHTMLEGLLNGPLFIPRFRPYVKGLVYQYVCFTNYEATRLQVSNPEVPEDDAESQKLWVAIGMANDIRQSETAFALQMEQRDRGGEAPLPSLGHEQDLAGTNTTTLTWGYVPEGLSEYPEGQTASSVAATTGGEEDPSVYGPAYVRALELRNRLDDFKGRIDQMQRILDGALKLQNLRARAAREEEEARRQAASGELPPDYQSPLAALDEELSAAQAERERQLREMSELLSSIRAAEDAMPYHAAMEKCIEKYGAVELRKAPLQELAADATREFKSPVFNRMKELLQLMKEMKKAHRAAQAAA